MASFFNSFRSSLMPKHLLRFALSRLDLLDAQALDLENLDFALGRNTVLEFRDVGLVLQKLERLLELPATFSLQKAKVLALRVTIPMDFYTSPITAEVDGVDIRLRIASKPEGNEQHPRKRRKGTGTAEVVPTAADLAQSFLETQPVEEKRELEEALAAETQDLGASVAISETESDDGSTFGTGQALSLPAFLTDFLQGIVDRIQIRVRGVTFQVDVDVPVDGAPAPELVTFQLSMDSINVEGVTTSAQAADGGATIVPKEGKRHVLLDNIRAFLITEANVFSSLAPSPSMPSSVVSRSPEMTEARIFPELGGRLESSVSSDSAADPDDLSQDRYPLQDSEAAFNIPYDLEENNGQETEEAVEPTSPLSTPRASVYQDSVHQDSVQGTELRGLFQGSDHQGSGYGSVHEAPSSPALREHAKSTLVEPGPVMWSTSHKESRSEPFLRPPDSFHLSDTPSPQASVHSGSASSSGGAAGAEDLSESRLYSHEEAASMYMSAFSQTDSVRRGAMPGSWDDSDVFSDAESGPLEDTAASHAVPSATISQSDQGRGGAESMNRDGPAESTLHCAPTDRPRSLEGIVRGDSADGDAGSHAQQPLKRDELEPQHDDIPTPRGPARLVKEILSVSSVSVYLPSTHGHVQVMAPDLGKSVVSHDLPGAFSVHSAASMSPNVAQVGPDIERASVDRSVEIMVKPVDVRFDMSIGFLLAMVISRLFDVAKPQSSEAVDSATSKPTSATPDIKLTVERLSVHFLEKLVGIADTPERLFQKQTATDFGADILLQANVVDLQGSMSIGGSQREANFTVDKFNLGYANDDIFSFDRSVQMFESVASTFPTAGHDISVKITSGPETSRVEINTLPLHVKLDLQRLDDTFSWFGGLSGFLNMGSSITSNASRGGKAPNQPAQKAKGVRFEAPTAPDDQAVAREHKTDLRINGILLDVVGKDCSVTLNTSALKLVNRDKGIGVHLSRIRLFGPQIRNSKAPIPVIAEVVDTRLDYSMLPRTQDLERLLELITPSKIKFDEDEDEIMVDTLLRQRRKGPVLSLTVGKARVDAGNLQQLSCLPSLVEDLAKLGTVAKYLPEDDRPGLLTLCHIKSAECDVDFGGRFGTIQASLADLEVAHITVPALVAVAVGATAVTRNKIEELVGSAPVPTSSSSQRPPVVMMRLIDDIEPVFKVNLNGLSVEYRVPTIMDVLNLAEDATPQDFEASLAASVANLGDQAHAAIKRTASGPSSRDQARTAKAIKVDVAFHDCLIGLNPLGMPSKLAVVLTDARLEVKAGTHDTIGAQANLKKTSILLVDDVLVLESAGAPFASTRRPQVAPSPQVTELCGKGYVNICQISSARVSARAVKDPGGETRLTADLRDALLVVETCADSTQTLIALANALKPPTPPSKEIKYRTSIVPVQDLLASISADAFGHAEGDYDYDKDFAIADELAGTVPDEAGSEDDFFERRDDSPLNVDSPYYEEGTVQEELFDATNSSLLAGSVRADDTGDGFLLSTASLDVESVRDDFSVNDSFFQQTTSPRGVAHRWNSKKNTYDDSNDALVQRSPLTVSVRDVHVIWHLFDGYDWARTREVIAKAVQDVEAKAYERRARADRRGGYEQDSDEDETVIGDFLFNSIYIGIPANRDPKELTQAINKDLQDMETASVATTALTTTTVRGPPGQHRRSKSLKLNRSKRHKITFELKGVNADLVVFPPGSGETVSSIDLRIRDLDIFDHVPESTWKKFAMYDFDAGERESGASMVHLEIINTKPVPFAQATELVLMVRVLPLRLHVDQDALDFITRFFEFKDDSVPIHASPSDVPFIQRIDVKQIPVRLDFKPKRVDYAGLRSGRTTEFMNFVILEDARMVLRHVILYGVSGFDSVGKQLNDIWMDDVKRRQLPGVLAGLAPVRQLVNAGSGFRDLIEIPLREYRKDGRIIRSVRKGAVAFAKTTGTEVVKLGAKLAIGTQNALQGAEGLFVPSQSGEASSSAVAVDDWEEAEYGGEERHRKISLYADQPLGILQGVRGGYASLAKDLSLARDAIIAVPAVVMESQSATGAAKAVLKKAPTIIFRPAIGTTKAIGQTLLGATNSLDPQHRRRVDAKYKKY